MTGDSSFNLFDYFLGEQRLAATGGRTALKFRGADISYNRLCSLVSDFAQKLNAHGVSQGDRVALLLYDSPEWVACFLAAVSSGAIAVPINTYLPAQDVQFILRDSGAKLVIAEDALTSKIGSDGPAVIPVVDSARPSLVVGETHASHDRAMTTSDSPAFLLYTSGSTGTPKGVLHSHGAIPHTVETYSKTVLRLTERDLTYSASRLFFAYGLGNGLSFPLAAGAAALLDTERPTPPYLARLLAEQRPTVFFGVPAVFRGLLELNASGAQVDASMLRLCVSAGEALPAAVFEDWRQQFGQAILDGIGSTEMLHIFMSNREGDARPGSSGRVIPGYEARLLDENGNELTGHQTGNLWIRGASATQGYWNRSELTEQTIRDGWVRTGDVYTRDADGYYYHVGRSDDCFKVQGLWVSPIEVEAALLSHPAIVEAAVVEGRDTSGLATARAFVVIRGGSESETLEGELLAHVASQLPRFKVPSRIDFIAELPRTVTGKVQRFKLKPARPPAGGAGT